MEFLETVTHGIPAGCYDPFDGTECAVFRLGQASILFPYPKPRMSGIIEPDRYGDLPVA